MAEDFGVQGRGAFYDQTGTIRDVIQNHIFQVLCNLAMESPARDDSESMRDEKVKVLKAIPPIEPQDLVRGTVSWLSRREGRCAELAGRDLRGPPIADQIMAMGGGSVLHPGGKESAADLYRDSGSTAQTTHDKYHGGRRAAELHTVSYQP